MTQAGRLGFIAKLHALLEDPFDSNLLRWVGDDAFEIVDNDNDARHALQGFDFRLLSSFLRQLSYYNFKRLSDRRRSGIPRTGATQFIVFTHPTGLFVRGDPSKLDGIVRRLRRPSLKDEKSRLPPPPAPPTRHRGGSKTKELPLAPRWSSSNDGHPVFALPRAPAPSFNRPPPSQETLGTKELEWPQYARRESWSHEDSGRRDDPVSNEDRFNRRVPEVYNPEISRNIFRSYSYPPSTASPFSRPASHHPDPDLDFVPNSFATSPHRNYQQPLQQDGSEAGTRYSYHEAPIYSGHPLNSGGQGSLYEILEDSRNIIAEDEQGGFF